MAVGKKTGGRDFKPGDKGNPGGRPKLPGDVVDARRLTKIEFVRIANKFLYLTRPQILAVVESDETPMLEHLVASILVKGVQEGDPQRINLFLDRLIGKVTDKLDVQMPRPTIVKLIGEDAALVIGQQAPNEEEE